MVRIASAMAMSPMNVSVTHESRSVQGAVTIVRASTRALVDVFVELPYAMYARDPHWVPPLRRDERRRLARGRNPFLDHADMELWVAFARGEPCGRIAAIEDRAHNEFHHERAAWFGFFEAADAETARALLDRAEAWSRARGCTALRGPVNPSLNESAGLLVEGFDDDPCLLMPYNPPQYADFVEGAGYGKAKDLLAWEIDLKVPLTQRIGRLADRLRRRRDLVVRALRMKSFDQDLAAMNEIYRSAWQDNWGFVPPTDAEMKQLAADFKPVIDPDLVLFAEIEGRPIACGVALPDLNQVLKRMNGRLLPFGIWHFLRRRSIITRARVVLLGVVAEHRRLGIYPLLVAELHRRAVANGYLRSELSWTLEDNDDVNGGIVAAGCTLYKKYRIYEKALG
jgi:GNAT superfamily N-acetyltransferase